MTGIILFLQPRQKIKTVFLLKVILKHLVFFIIKHTLLVLAVIHSKEDDVLHAGLRIVEFYVRITINVI